MSIYLKTSTDGVTWSAAQLVIDLTAGNPDHVQIVSPAIVHDGTQFIMFSSKSFTTLERRTSADGVNWSAPTAKVFGSFPVAKFAYTDVINTGGGKLFALVQDYSCTGTPESPAVSNLWLARSSDWGNTWATVQSPMLRSQGMSTMDIYRTTGLWESRNGADYFRLLFCGIDFDLKGREVWRIGYTNGYAPDAIVPTTGISVPGEVEAGGDVTGVQGDFRRLTARLGIFTRLVASSLMSPERGSRRHSSIKVGAASADPHRIGTPNSVTALTTYRPLSLPAVPQEHTLPGAVPRFAFISGPLTWPGLKHATTGQSGQQTTGSSSRFSSTHQPASQPCSP